MIDTDHADDPALASTPTQAESLRYSLEQAAKSIGLHVNANETKLMCFKQERAISTRSGEPMKLID